MNLKRQLVKTNILEDVELKPLQQVLPRCWNRLKQQPLVTWLEKERRPQDVSRMHSLGNIVVPQQAQKAFPILLRMYRERASI